MQQDTAWCPWWYVLLLEADRLHCKPWELIGAEPGSIFWRDIAYKAMAAENGARRDLKAMR